MFDDTICDLVNLRIDGGCTEITANRSDTESWRIHRLHRIIGYVYALSPTLVAHIKKIHDHKGRLTVTWRIQPTDKAREVLTLAWSSSIGDLGDLVDHEFMDASGKNWTREAVDVEWWTAE